jgi:predicted TIM-barrel enzyme
MFFAVFLQPAVAATVTLPPTTKKPDSEEVSDAESESRRLAQKMKEGVEHINLSDYLDDEDGDVVSNTNKTASTSSQKGEKAEASNVLCFRAQSKS